MSVNGENGPIVSFEFFPPKSAAALEQFKPLFDEFARLLPAFVSVTWGALGANREPSLALHRWLRERASAQALTDAPIAAHLSCLGTTVDESRSNIRELRALGVTRFVALRGDYPPEADTSRPIESTLRHADELVRLLREEGVDDISVAAYPEAHPDSASTEDDIRWLKHKIEAGARRAITQFFFDAETFLRFRDKAIAAGIDVPLVPGILPVSNIEQVSRFARLCGASVPAWLQRDCSGLDTPEARNRYAVSQALTLCETLQKEGVEAFHLYTLNRLQPSLEVAKGLGLGSTSEALPLTG